MLAPKGGYVTLQGVVLPREVIEQMGNPHRAHFGMSHGAQSARGGRLEKKPAAGSPQRRASHETRCQSSLLGRERPR